MSHKIPLYKIYWDEEDVKSVTEIIRSGMFWAIGPSIEKFEKIVSEYAGAKYGVAFNSGTSALHAVMLACGIGKGDEVIVPSFTFIATANSALFTDAKPIFADAEKETYGLDPVDVEKKITRKTKAIMPIHYGGRPCKIVELKEIAKKYNLLLIEDAAESIGANINGKRVGSFGDAAMFSFCGNKIITTGEGGIIVTDSRDIYEKLKLVRSHGRLETENYFVASKTMDYITLGYNWRMSTMTAALGISQMNKLAKVIELRRKCAKYMTERLSKVKGITTPSDPKGYFNVYQMYTIRAEDRDSLNKHLLANGVSTKIFFDPVHLTEYYTKVHQHQKGELPTTEELSKEVLTLPIFPSMSVEDMDYIVENIKEFMKKIGTH